MMKSIIFKKRQPLTPAGCCANSPRRGTTWRDPLKDLNLKTFLNRLAAVHEEPCISVYMPTHQVTARKPKDRILFKNLLREAQECLVGRGMRTAEAKGFLGPALKLAKDSLFWEYQGNGLALFLAPRFFEYFISSLSFDQKVSVSHRFYLKSLLPVLYRGEHFFLLTLSKRETKLFRVTRTRMTEVRLEGLPDGVSRRSSEKQLQFHTGTQQGRGKRAALFHGHGGGSEDEKTGLIQYCREIDSAVVDLLSDEKAPMMVAGLDYVVATYRQANSYPYLVDDSIPGNPYSYSRDDLHRAAHAAMEPHLVRWREESLVRFGRGSEEGRACTDVAPLLQAAKEGRIEMLLVSLGAELFVRHDLESGRVDLHTRYEEGDVDVLDEAVVRTVLTGGEVYGIEEDEMPGHLPFVALLRDAPDAAAS